MVKRKALVLAVVWVMSLLTVGLWAQIGGGVVDPQTGRFFKSGQPFGPIITSPNIGFQRVAGPVERDGTISGRLLVRVDGEWLVATVPVAMRPAN